MVSTKDNIYKRAYSELYEILKRLPQSQKDKLPNNFIENIAQELDNEYKFNYNENISLDEQNLMTETKALIVEIYERYLCPEEEKEKWQKYDQICLNKIEEKRRSQYNIDNLFKNRKHIENKEPEKELPMEIKKENFGKKVINFIKRLFHVDMK